MCSYRDSIFSSIIAVQCLSFSFSVLQGSLSKRKVEKNLWTRETTVCLVPSAQLVALWRICFSYLRNRMKFISPLAELWFDTLLKCLTHLQELSEYILLPDFSLKISNHFVSLSFSFTLFKKSKNRFHKEACGDDNVFAVYFETFGNRICFSH